MVPLSALLSITIGLLAAWIVASTGARALKLIGYASDASAMIVASLAVGLVIWGNVLFGVAISAGTGLAGIAIASAGLLAIGAERMGEVAGWVRAAVGAGLASRAPWAAPARVLMLTMLIVGTVFAAAPVSGEDALKYHLASPALALLEGAWRFHPFLQFAQPGALEAVALPLLLAGLPGAWLVLHFVIFAAVAAGLHGLCLRTGHPEATPLAILAVVATPIAFLEAPGAVVDAAVLLGAVAALCGYLDWVDRPSTSSGLVVAGVSAGLCAASKYPGLFVVVALVAVVAIRRQGRAILLAAGCAMAASGAWYVFNWAQSGTPIWPATGGVFHASSWSAASAQLFQSELDAHHRVLGTGWVRALFSPVMAAVAPLDLFETSGGVGVLVGLLAPAAFAGDPRHRRDLLVFGAIVFALWFAVSHNGRFLLPAIAVVAVVGAAGVSAWRGSRVVAVALGAAIAFHGALVLVVAEAAAERSFPWVAGLMMDTEYLRRTAKFSDGVAWINANTGKDAVIATGPELGFHLARRYVWVGPLSGLIDRGNIQNWRDFVVAARATGAGFLLLGGRPVPPEDAAAAGATLVYRSPEPFFVDGELRWFAFEPSFVYAL